jgi:hypothetical protein
MGGDTDPGTPLQTTHPYEDGRRGGRNSTLDLAWCNMAALIQGTFTGTAVDFGGSQGSDHALIRTIASTPVAIYRAPADRTERFDTDIDADTWDVTCRWHVRLDVSWVGSVANAAEMTVLRADPKPLLS